MPKYRLVLTWTQQGRDPANPNPVSERRNEAVQVAHDFSVTGPGGQPIRNHVTDGPDGAAATWIVEGADGDVDGMIKKWEGFNNVRVEKILLGP